MQITVIIIQIAFAFMKRYPLNNYLFEVNYKKKIYIFLNFILQIWN